MCAYLSGNTCSGMKYENSQLYVLGPWECKSVTYLHVLDDLVLEIKRRITCNFRNLSDNAYIVLHYLQKVFAGKYFSCAFIALFSMLITCVYHCDLRLDDWL